MLAILKLNVIQNDTSCYWCGFPSNIVAPNQKEQQSCRLAAILRRDSATPSPTKPLRHNLNLSQDCYGGLLQYCRANLRQLFSQVIWPRPYTQVEVTFVFALFALL